MERNQFKCMRCGSLLDIDSVVMRSDVGLARDESEDTEVLVCSCPNCGMGYELYDVPENEKGEYDYWKNP